MAVLVALTGAARVADADETRAGHRRFETAQGAVHVWMPERYDAATADLVLYVHGYWVDVDTAWAEHALPLQFAASGRNALFVVPEAPSGNEDSVAWPRLDALVDAVRSQGIDVPPGPAIAVAHSGGYRTVLPWLRDDRLRSVVLLDAMYGGEAQWVDWLEGDPVRRLIVKAALTARRTDQFLEGVGEGGVRARIEVERPGLGHMELVTGRETIPAVLRRALD